MDSLLETSALKSACHAATIKTTGKLDGDGVADVPVVSRRKKFVGAMLHAFQRKINLSECGHAYATD